MRSRLTATLCSLSLALALALGACSDDSATSDSGAADSAAPDSATADRGAEDGAGADASQDGGRPDLAGDLPKADAPSVDAPMGDSLAGDTLAADTVAVDSLSSSDLPTSGCDAAKIAFTQANPSKYELFEFCFPAGDTVTMAQAKLLDPGLNCAMSSGGIVAKCPTGRWRCMGTLQKDPSGAIVQTSWDRLCLLSQLPNIGQIKGGYFI
jgi:hypothetical protein